MTRASVRARAGRRGPGAAGSRSQVRNRGHGSRGTPIAGREWRIPRQPGRAVRSRSAAAGHRCSSPDWPTPDPKGVVFGVASAVLTTRGRGPGHGNFAASPNETGTGPRRRSRKGARVARSPPNPARGAPRRGDPEVRPGEREGNAAGRGPYRRRITCPARAPVSSPSSTAISPFTSTQGIPSGAPSGSRMVAWSTTPS